MSMNQNNKDLLHDFAQAAKKGDFDLMDEIIHETKNEDVLAEMLERRQWVLDNGSEDQDRGDEIRDNELAYAD